MQKEALQNKLVEARAKGLSLGPSPPALGFCNQSSETPLVNTNRVVHFLLLVSS